MELYILKLQNFIDMHNTNNNEAFQFATPNYCWCSLAKSLPYLVLLDVRLTELSHSLEKYENSGKLSGRPPTAKIISLLLIYCQLPSKTSEKLEYSTLFSQNSKNDKTLKYSRNFASSNCGTFIFWGTATYPKNFEYSNLAKKYHDCKKLTNYNSILIIWIKPNW